jgi:hypothetical protein
MAGRYEIRVRGRLRPAVSATFDGLEVRLDGADSVLHGVIPDQEALYGVLDRLQGFGLELVEVRRVPPA